MKKFILLLLLIASFSFAVQLLDVDGIALLPGNSSIGTAYFMVDPVNKTYDYQNEPRRVLNPYWTPADDWYQYSAVGIKLAASEKVEVKIKVADAHSIVMPHNGSNYLIGYNYSYPIQSNNEYTVVMNDAGDSSLGLPYSAELLICTIENKSSTTPIDIFITIGWFFNININKKTNSGVYDFSDAIEVIFNTI